MCPFERWLGFCPFVAFRRFWRAISGGPLSEVEVPVKWGPRS